MVLFKERESRGAPEGVIERDNELKVPKEIEKLGVEARPEHFTGQVEKRGKGLIQTPKTRTVTIQLPTDRMTLISWAKGSVTSSLTWFAAFWLRMIKKAAHFGWKVMKGKGS